MSTPPDNPNYGQIFTKGVKYIKIHKLDKDGENYGPQLALADNIIINYNDIGNVQYNILTTQQQGDYYMMGIVPQENTSSLNNVKDWDLYLAKAPISKTLNPFDVALWNDDNDGGLIVVGGNSGNYYNTITDVYDFNFPNVPASITSSVSVGSFSGLGGNYFSMLIPTQYAFDFVEGIPINQWENYGIQLINVIPITGNGFFQASSILNDNWGGEYYFGGAYISFSGQITLLQVYEEINQSQSPYDSPNEGLLTINPDVSNFEYSDYNALFGNAAVPQFSNIYQDIDYASSGGPIPINFDLITSGSALKAQIQDSNYTQAGWNNGRYKGSKNSSIDFNQ